MNEVKDNTKCQECLFYGLCLAAKLEYCNEECYFEKPDYIVD